MEESAAAPAEAVDVAEVVNEVVGFGVEGASCNREDAPPPEVDESDFEGDTKTRVFNFIRSVTTTTNATTSTKSRANTTTAHTTTNTNTATASIIDNVTTRTASYHDHPADSYVPSEGSSMRAFLRHNEANSRVAFGIAEVLNSAEDPWL